jgi:predicted GNAT family acetyltransferase
MFKDMGDPIRIVHTATRRRYELYMGGELASFAEYTPSGDVIVFDHTETTPRFRGLGLAGRVVAYALDDVRAAGKTVVPACWFVADFIKANPAYQDILAA